MSAAYDPQEVLKPYMPQPKRYAHVPCKYHDKPGGCRFGDRCEYRHDGPGGGGAVRANAPRAGAAVAQGHYAPMPAGRPTYGAVVAVAVGPGVPPGAPPGGYWVEEQYCGLASWLIGIFILPCIACCPVDSRTVYVAPNGRRYYPSGEIAF